MLSRSSETDAYDSAQTEKHKLKINRNDYRWEDVSTIDYHPRSRATIFAGDVIVSENADRKKFYRRRQ